MGFDTVLLEERLSSYSVAFGLTLKNFTGHTLRHVETYLHYGQVEEGFEAPAEVGINSEANVLLARNTYGLPSGSSGVMLWRIGDTIYHLILGWSAPRNFYTHSNTMMMGIVNGIPVQLKEGGFVKLFNKLYYDTFDSQSFFSRVSCDFGHGFREGSFSSNRFQIGAQLREEHKSFNEVCVKGSYATFHEDLPLPVGRKAIVKLITHSYKGAWASRTQGQSTDQNHVGLVFEWTSKKRDEDTIILCELVQKSNESKPSCIKVNKAALLKERKGFNLRAFHLGEVLSCEEDLMHAAMEKVRLLQQELPFPDRAFSWICRLAELLNVPNQEVIGVAREAAPVASSSAAAMEEEVQQYKGPMMDVYVGELQGAVLHAFSSPAAIVNNEKIAGMECTL